jgi:hypothetical protein
MPKRSTLSDRGQTVAEILALGVVRRLRRRARGAVGLPDRTCGPVSAEAPAAPRPVVDEELLAAAP